MNISRRSCLKQFLPLFSVKLDTDFSLYKITANTKTKPKKDILIDVPLLEELKQMNNELLVIEIRIMY
jgi:hypothetical protein